MSKTKNNQKKPVQNVKVKPEVKEAKVKEVKKKKRLTPEQKEARIKKIVTFVVIVLIAVAIILGVRACDKDLTKPEPTPTPTPTATPIEVEDENGEEVTTEGYYKKPDYEGVSIAKALEGIANDTSYFYRVIIAAQNGFENYRGTAEQNTEMLGMLLEGKLKAVELKETYEVPVYTGVSIADALEYVGVDGSYYNRAVIAAGNGIKDYRGTAEQNTEMLGMLLAGKLKKVSY